MTKLMALHFALLATQIKTTKTNDNHKWYFKKKGGKTKNMVIFLFYSPM
jgi:hypothetical protein